MNFDFKRMLQYQRNIGDQDQKIRYGVGAASILLSIFLGSIFLLLLGIALLASGYTRFCPVYAGMGRSTLPPCCAAKAKAEEHACCGGETHQH